MECVGKWTATVRDRANNTQQELSGALDAARLRLELQRAAAQAGAHGPTLHTNISRAAIAQLPSALRTLLSSLSAHSALSAARASLRSRTHLAQLLRDLAADPHGGGEEESRAETLRLCVAQATGVKVCVLWVVDQAVGTLFGWVGGERVEAGEGEGVGKEVAEHVRRCEEEEDEEDGGRERERERERDGQNENEEEGNAGDFCVEGPRVMVNIRDEEGCLCAVLECIYAHPSHFRRKEHLDVLRMAGELALAAARRAEHFAAATQTRVPPPSEHFGSASSRAIEDPLL
eukprot:jgi/Chlat1/7922/Chrsp68S07385